MQTRWWFSVVLMAAYLGAFHVWQVLPRAGVVATGVAISLALIAAGLAAARQGCFHNGWDALFHLSVIVDLFLEAVLIRVHEGYGFYFCAMGFAVVLTGYRFWCIANSRTRRRPIPAFRR